MVDDEVSLVLRHFKPKPEFVPKSEFRSTRPKKKQNRGFSSVQYIGRSCKLRLSYLGDRTIFLKFEVSCVKPVTVACVHCNGPSSATKLLKIEELCMDISSADDSSKTSLFSVVSRLLLSLNDGLPYCGSVTGSERSAVLTSILSQQMDAQVIDLEILLLRCAAASRKRAIVCTPAPFEFTGDDSAASRILAVTENMTEPISGRTTGFHRHEQDLMAFLLSLPWAEQGDLKTTTEKDQRTGATTIHICLDIEKTIGDESPLFANLANMRGVTTAFHGTKTENAWSILNYGLQNLSNTRLCKNGAIMGDGVYLSTSYDVASFFATKENSSASFQVWRHPSLLDFLDIQNLTDFRSLEGCNVSCFPVFEAKIILPPSSSSKQLSSNNDNDCTRREGKYFVVPNSEHIRITKLHLTLELTKKKSVPPFLRLLITVFVACFLIYCLP